MTFTYNGRAFELLDAPYNSTITNERAVEIPIARSFVAEQDDDGLEVGNVLGHYGCVAPRRVVDRYDTDADVSNLDVFAIDGAYDWIVSVSTIEHVRNGEPSAADNPWGAVAALAYLRGLLREGGRMLVTVGLGQNPVLDWTLLRLRELDRLWDEPANPLGEDMRWSALTRKRGATPAENEWIDTHAFPSIEVREYGPTHGANAVWIGEWGPV